MYRNLDLDRLVPHPHNANKISRRFAKKLRYNIEQTGLYETLLKPSMHLIANPRP